jgi:hypothetical protein
MGSIFPHQTFPGYPFPIWNENGEKEKDKNP